MTLRTDHRCDTLKADAVAEASGVYPPGTRLRVRLRADWPVKEYVVMWPRFNLIGAFVIRSVETGYDWNFYPAIHPHEVLGRRE